MQLIEYKEVRDTHICSTQYDIGLYIRSVRTNFFFVIL